MASCGWGFPHITPHCSTAAAIAPVVESGHRASDKRERLNIYVMAQQNFSALGTPHPALKGWYKTTLSKGTDINGNPILEGAKAVVTAVRTLPSQKVVADLILISAAGDGCGIPGWGTPVQIKGAFVPDGKDKSFVNAVGEGSIVRARCSKSPDYGLTWGIYPDYQVSEAELGFGDFFSAAPVVAVASHSAFAEEEEVGG